MNIELFKRGRGFLPAGEETERRHKSMDDGEFILCKLLGIRDPVKHRRYWKLMTVCAANCERIILPYNAVMFIHNKEDVHTAIKLCTGHCTTVFDIFNLPVFQIPKSTDFESMTSEEWDAYWPRVLDVVQEHIMPGVSIPSVQLELQRLMGMAA
jgi:hypothetical protein